MKYFLLLVFSFSVFYTYGQSVHTDSFYFARSQQMLLAINNGNYDKALTFFDASVSSDVNADVLKKAWGQLFSKIGNLNSTGKPRIEMQGGYHTVYIPCVFDDAILDLKIQFSDRDQILSFSFTGHAQAGDYHLPAYADTSRIQEQDIIVQTGKYKLPGKFTYPKPTHRTFPVIILVHGSGAEDMDETISENKPFKDLAYGLAAQGIGVIRYDKRSYTYPSQMAGALDVTLEQETIMDAISAAMLARKLPGVDSTRIYIAGHSLGAMAAPIIARQSDGLMAGIVLMAAPARPLEQVLYEQSSYLASLVPSDHSKRELEMLKNEADRVGKGDFSPKTPSSMLPMNLPARYWLFLHNYHQTETAQKLKIPILVLQGERDYQVSMEDFKIWQKTLSKHKDALFLSYPRLNHLFMEGEGKSVPAEYDSPGHVAPYVIDDIAKWILMPDLILH